VADRHSPADNIVYDLVSVQYHALKSAALQDQFLQDADGHDDVRQFFEEVARQDADRALRCHELLAALTGGRKPGEELSST
jgi:hypothetical protein